MSKKESHKCRTCLKLNTKFQSLDTKPKMANIDKSYKELLNSIAQIVFDDDDKDKMPQGICSACSKRIRDSYSFIEQVKESNKTLLEDYVYITDDDPREKLDQSLEEPEIKEEPIPDNDVEMSEPKEEVDSDSSSSVAKDMAEKLETSKNEDVKPEGEQQKTEQSVLFPECVLNENVLSEDDSMSATDLKKDDDEDYDPLENRKRKKTTTKDDPDDEKNLPVPCEDCGRVFQNASQLKRHKRYTHLPDELKVQCPHCPSKFSTRQNMHTHMRSLHKIEPVMEQSAKIGKVLACEHCQKTFCYEYKLKAHLRIKHGPDSHLPKPEKIKPPAKKFLCTLCGFTCNSQPNLDVHYRRHTGDKPFKCNYCERGYCRLYDLQMHILSHTGEKPFKCTVCEKAFRRSSKLKNHMRTHTNERPYKCNECEKAFKQSKDLTVHRRIHTGERPYKCNVCESTFIQSNSLRLHQTKTNHFDSNIVSNNNSSSGGGGGGNEVFDLAKSILNAQKIFDN